MSSIPGEPLMPSLLYTGEGVLSHSDQSDLDQSEGLSEGQSEGEADLPHLAPLSGPPLPAMAQLKLAGCLSSRGAPGADDAALGDAALGDAAAADDDDRMNGDFAIDLELGDRAASRGVPGLRYSRGRVDGGRRQSRLDEEE